MYIIYLYPIYISCPAFQKFFPKRAAACMLRPYCYLLFVICYDCARKGPPRRGDQTCVTTLLLFVICYDWARRAGQMRALVEGAKCFTVICDSTVIAGRLHCNRPAIPYQSSVSMFHAAWRLILVMQVMLGIGHCLEFTTWIEQTACHPVAEPLAWNWICSLCSRKAVKISSAVQSHPSRLRQCVTHV